MVWFLLGLFCYTLVLWAEGVLVGAGAAEFEALRQTGGAASKRALSQVQTIRPTMSALLLARLWLKVLLVVFGILTLITNHWLYTTLSEIGLSTGLGETLLWIALVGLYALATAFVFWLLKHWEAPYNSPKRRIFWLQRLSGYVTFWKVLFAPFLRKDKTHVAVAVETPTAAATAFEQTTSPQTGEKREMELLKSIVKFGDVTVKNVMQPRTKVAAIDFRADFSALLDLVRTAGFSRLPVYDEDLDNVVGILYVKDLVPHLDAPPDFEWQSLVQTDVLFTPESKRAAELLEAFKRQKLHMAIVVDEYGGSAGIVTLEDILEEVTGEIQDEFDEEQAVGYRKLDDHTFIFEGQTALGDVCRIAGLPADAFEATRGDADTLAGLLLELTGDIPKPGDEVKSAPYLFTVVSGDSRRIQQVKLDLRF